MSNDQARDEVTELLRSVFAGAADELDADAERGEHLWTADNGDRCYARLDDEGSVILIVRADGRPDGVQRCPGVDFRELV
jgi:hypothetical protein